MKKIISIILSLLMIIGIISIPNKSIASFSIDKADLYSKGYYEDHLRLGNMGIVFHYVVYAKDGKEYPAYCLNKNLEGATINSPYSVSTKELLTDVRIWRVIINGYPYKTPAELGCITEAEAYIATKQAVYCILYDREPSAYNAVNDTGTRVLNALNKIVENAKNSNEVKASSDLTIEDITPNWEQDKINNKYVSKTFSVSAKAGFNTYNVTLEGMNIEGAKIVDGQNNEKNNFKKGENFKIIIPITNMKEKGNFNINVAGKVATKPVLYGYSADRTRQDYAITGEIYEDGEGSKTVNYGPNETKIIILKQAKETNEMLEGVKFNLLDKNKNILYSELTTNEKGEIKIENLEPGTYYIEETKPANGYAAYEELVEVNLKYNETLTVKVTNEKEITTVEEPKVTQNNIEVVAKLPKTGM